MSDKYVYSIEPVKGFELLSKMAPNLPKQVDRYNGRHISLNERFSIYERGYIIKNIAKVPETKFSVTLTYNKILPREATIAKMRAMQAANEKRTMAKDAKKDAEAK
ncbi:unnamed protein product, partial [Mesorhabditis belari]|uniref:Uncharacterized protein n=1 Tax=Mesorhabditis belari TaxID=2138241 RepID=A0AAF3E9K7_9BILA